MLDICLLGTAGMMPQPNRWLTAMMARYNGSSLLIDCGEGTQIAMKEAGLSPNPIDTICFTHYHADHISGLPGLLLSMGNSDRTEPVTMIGPKGLEHVVNSLRVIAPELPFPLRFIELQEPEESFVINGYHIHAFRVQHNVTCYGYCIEIPRDGKFDVAAAQALPIPVQKWSVLQRGETVEWEGRTYTPDMVMGPPRKGIKVTYCTDTRPNERIVRFANQADLEESIEVVIAGYQKKNAIMSDKEKMTVAYHEIGHALVAALQTHSAPVQKITIVPRTSGALGYTMQVEEGNHYLMTKEEIENKIATFAGGRAAEEIAVGSVSTGASNDIEQTTKLARAMITRYGMSEEFDMVALETVNNAYLGGDASLACSAETQTEIDRQVVELVKKQHEKARNLLMEHKEKLEQLSLYLYDKETITGEEFMNILNS